MTLVTLRPSASQAFEDGVPIPISSAAVLRVVGAATAQAALSDNTDGSYITGLNPSESIVLTFPSASLPSGATMKQIGYRARIGDSVVASHALQFITQDTASDPIPTGINEVLTSVGPTNVTLRTHATSTRPAGPTINILDDIDHTPGSFTARVYELYVDVTYVNQPSLVVSSPRGIISDSTPPNFSWTPLLDADGGTQSTYQLNVFTRGTYTGGGFDPDSSLPYYEVAETSGSATSVDATSLFVDGDYRVYVRIAQTVNGTRVYSPWVTSDFSVRVTTSPPSGQPNTSVRVPPVMRGVAKWDFYLARTSDMSLLGSLNAAKNKQIQLGLNKSGQMSGTIRGSLDIANLITEHATCVIAFRNAVPIWSGPIFQTNDQLPEDTCQFTAQGWFELFNHRILKTGQDSPDLMPSTDATTMVYSQIDACDIAVDLIRRTNAEFPTRIEIGTIQSSNGLAIRNRTYQRFANIGNEINTLTTLDAGFDYDIDPMLRTFNIWYGMVKQGTTIFGRGQDRPRVIFGYNWGPKNVRSIARTRDGSQTMNQETAVGTYGSAQVPPQGFITESIAALGLFEESQSLSDVPGDQAQGTFLEAYAAAEVSVREYPQQIFQLTPMPATSNASVPEPFVDYGIGDIVYFVSKFGRIQVPAIGEPDVPQPLRVFGMNISVDDNGTENLDALQGVMS